MAAPEEVILTALAALAADQDSDSSQRQITVENSW